MSAPKAEGKKVLLRNSRARHDYFIEDTIEAGLVLVGSEVKSLRDGKASLGEAYAKVEAGEAFLFDMQVSEWAFANRFNHAPRSRGASEGRSTPTRKPTACSARASRG